MKRSWLKKLELSGMFGAAIVCYLLVGTAYSMLQRANVEPAQPKADLPAVTLPPLTPITADGLYTEINKIRHENGVEPMVYSTELNKSAQIKCDDMVNNGYYDHKNPKTGKEGYKYVFEAMRNVNYASENLNEYTLNDQDTIIKSWLDSPSHKAAILDPKYTHAGYAVCVNKDAYDVVAHMAEVKAPAPQVNNYYTQPRATTRYVPTYTPTYTKPIYCNTQYYSYLNSASTTCY